jgi:hypothetical protein
MRKLVTLEWIQTRDVKGLLVAYDSTSLEDAITMVSNDLCQKVGHDWGDSTSYSEILEGVKGNTLYLEGITKYPLRTLTETLLDGVDPEIEEEDFRIFYNRAIGDLGYKLRRYDGGSWKCRKVTITGDWGWTDTPDDVKEAIYRLMVRIFTGQYYNQRMQAGSAVFGDKVIKRKRTPDGAEIEYATPYTTSYEVLTCETTGDDYADSVIAKYVWATHGGIV